ncbi:MAG: hypothetical protein WCO51_04730 [bacterium]
MGWISEKKNGVFASWKSNAIGITKLFVTTLTESELLEIACDDNRGTIARLH